MLVIVWIVQQPKQESVIMGINNTIGGNLLLKLKRSRKLMFVNMPKSLGMYFVLYFVVYK